ncbi:MAG TPA: MlaD family protein, partial [Parasegetibacter sp.]
MKISNETKIGLLTAVGIVVLILGFNFLKGKNLFDKRTRIFAVFSKIEGLTVSNPVTINGLQVGAVAELKELDKNMSNIVVGIDLTKDINIPENSTAVINPSLGGLGTTSIVIELGSSSN